MTELSLTSPLLSWRDGIPYNSGYDDLYFSREGGLQESLAVFLHGNGLPPRWQGCVDFTIAETGFGTGLNFLLTATLWLEQAPPTAVLHYIAVEKQPLTPEQLAQALGCWPRLQPLLGELLAVYPEPLPGFHRSHLCAGRIRLTLLWGEAQPLLAECDAQVDAWYLDGFAPAKNPAMWSAALFTEVARLSAAGATFSTFTAAGRVKRGLSAVGFAVEKVRGFGNKRERLQGRLLTPPPLTVQRPWFHIAPPGRPIRQEITIIGAGIAGVSAAYQLSQRGWRVTLMERHAAVATQGSGNLAGVVMPRLTLDNSPQGQFFMAAFQYTVAWLERLKRADQSLPWQHSGLLQLYPNERLQRIAQLGLPSSVARVVDQATASELCGAAVAHGGVVFPQGGWLDPAALCQWLLKKSPSIELKLHQSALLLERRDDEWVILCGAERMVTTPHLLIATGTAAADFAQSAFLPLTAVRGQLTYLPVSSLSPLLTMPVCYEGYVIPAYQGYYCVGATYKRGDGSTALKEAEQQENLTQLYQALPQWAVGGAAVLSGRVAQRATTPDYLPYIGPLPPAEGYAVVYADLKHGKRSEEYPLAEYQAGLYISTGHGSRGLVTAPLAAELLADYLEGAMRPVARSLLQLCHPARRLAQALRRGKKA